MKAPAFPLYSNDFYVDTITWDLEPLGLYSRLLFVEWSNGPLPSDPKKLAKIAGISPKKLSNLFQICSSKFVLNEDGNLVNPKMEEIRAKQTKYAESRKEIANKRWENKDAQAMHMHEHMDMHTGCLSFSSSNIPSKKKKVYRAKSPIPPPIEEVISYCKERKNGIDPQKWYDHYAARGWMIGKNRMRDWKAAVRTWEQNEFGGKTVNPRTDADEILDKCLRGEG